MKTIHWILLAGLGYYLYSQKGKQTMTPLVALPAQYGGNPPPGYIANISTTGEITYTYDPKFDMPLKTF